MRNFLALITIGDPGDPLAREGEVVELDDDAADELLAIGAIEPAPAADEAPREPVDLTPPPVVTAPGPTAPRRARKTKAAS